MLCSSKPDRVRGGDGERTKMCASERVLQQDETADELPVKTIHWGLKMGGGGGGL